MALSLADFVTIRQKRTHWNSRQFARPSNTHSNRRLSKKMRWRLSCAAVVNAITRPSKSVQVRGGNGGVNITEASQSAQLPAIKEVCPEYRDINAQVLQDALTRLDRAFQRFFARVKTGETPGCPRFHGANR
jgi:putative transposase